MNQVESILAQILENVQDTVDELDVQSIIRAGAGKQTLAFVYEADGTDRANRIAAQMQKELGKRLYSLLQPYRLLMQMSTSSQKPVLLKEWMPLTAAITEHCPLPGKWLNTPEHKDENLGSSLRVSLVLWIEHIESLN